MHSVEYYPYTQTLMEQGFFSVGKPRGSIEPTFGTVDISLFMDVLFADHLIDSQSDPISDLPWINKCLRRNWMKRSEKLSI